MSTKKVFAGFLLGILFIQAAWIAAMPPFRGSDEFDHVFRAEGVAHGAFLPGMVEPDVARGSLTPARTSVIAAATPVCDQYQYTDYFSCHPFQDTGSGWARIFSGAGRYNPSYYLVVGSVGAFFEGEAVDYAMRITSALMCALLLAWAATTWVRLNTSRWATLALLVALTPVFLYSTAVAAPNGLSYAAGLLVWVCGLLLLRDRSQPVRSDLAGLVVGSVTLCNTHTTGPLWLLLIACALVLLEPRRAWALARDRSTWPAIAAIAVGGIAAVTWTLVSGANIASDPQAFAHGPQLLPLVESQLIWLLQTIAAFPLRTDYAPSSVYLLWLVPFVALLVLAVRTGGRVFRTTAFSVVASIAVSVSLTLVSYRTQGFAWQGRYSLPLVVGIVLVPGAYAVGKPWRAFFDCAIASMVVAAAISVADVARDENDFLVRPWTSHIPGGFVLAGLFAVLGTVLLGLTLSRALRANTSSAPSEARS